MQKKKTGELFSFCCESVAILNEEDIKMRKKLRNIGLEIGLLFQIIDDLIDYRGDSITAGKPTKSDKKKGKATLISLLGHQNTIKYGNRLKYKIFKKLNKFGKRSEDLRGTIKYILERRK